MEGLESFFTSGQQLQLFLLSCAFGIPIGIVFDIFRVKSLSYQGASVAPVTVLIEYIFYRGVRGDTGR